MGRKSAIPSINVAGMRRRLAAWWEGEEFVETTSPAATTPAEPAPLRLTESYTPRQPQLASHLLIAEELWGQGFVGPGDADFISNQVSKLGISREKSLAYLGLGLGGPAREICRESGIWITGYESRSDMIEPASEQLLMAGLARKVSVQLFEPGRTELPERKFDIVVIRDEMHAYPDKAQVIQAVFEALKPGGSVLITDYFAQDENAATELAEGCFSPFWGPVHLCTADEMTQWLMEPGFELRVKKDLSETYAEMIAAAAPQWSGLMEMLRSPGDRIADRRTFAAALATEAEQWTARDMALKEGQLKVYRFLVMKPEGEVR